MSKSKENPLRRSVFVGNTAEALHLSLKIKLKPGVVLLIEADGGQVEIAEERDFYAAEVKGFKPKQRRRKP